jgi:hypothetical protein
MRSALVVLFVFGSGCADYAEYRTGGSGSPASRGATCKNAAPYGRSFGAVLSKQYPAKNDAISTVESSVVASCESDKWPTEVLTCLGNAKDPAASEACISTLSPELQKKMEDSAFAKMK